MAINAPFNAAAAAYGQAARLGTGGGAAPAAGGAGDFANLLAQSLDGVVDAGKAADSKAMGLVGGQGNVVDVVTAVAETELAVESMVAIRDRVISAYEEIMRMPI
jgi:flagellar hook-basal body complex protein FliE